MSYRTSPDKTPVYRPIRPVGSCTAHCQCQPPKDSGILRLSDLRAEAPNSNYPMFIVASEDRRRKVFEELRRPTFSGPCLRLNEVIRFLGYEKVREIDESSKSARDFDTNTMMAAGEIVPPI